MDVSLQINLAPGDLPHARLILKEQLLILSGQVNEIILVVDTKPAKGRFANGWVENQDKLNLFLSEEINPHFNVRIIPVDYSLNVKKAIAQYFFGISKIPEKDFRGGPFYAYFFGLFSACNDHVFHLDSDIFLGGGSQKWLEEAKELFKNDKKLFILSPLPGPPHREGKLIDQPVLKKLAPYTFQIAGMSTRIFLIDKSKFAENQLTVIKPDFRYRIKALVEGNDVAALPEHIILNFMEQQQLKRIDFLGTGKGLWSLHPPYRNADFYERLPEILEMIKSNNLPNSQAGFYDLVDEVCDWTDARNKLKENRWWKRCIKNLVA